MSTATTTLLVAVTHVAGALKACFVLRRKSGRTGVNSPPRLANSSLLQQCSFLHAHRYGMKALVLLLLVATLVRGTTVDSSLQGDAATPAAEPAADSLPSVVDSVEQAAQHTAQLTFEDELQGLERLLQVQGFTCSGQGLACTPCRVLGMVMVAQHMPGQLPVPPDHSCSLMPHATGAER